MKVYAPGLSVAVVDGPPGAVAVSGQGHVKVYAPGLSVEVPDLAGPPPLSRTLNSSRFTCFDSWNSGSRYERWQELMVLKGPSTLRIRTLAAGGVRLPFQGASYTLLCDGVPVQTITPTVGALTADFSFDAGAIQAGWHVFDVHGPETFAFYPMFVLHGEAPPQSWMPSCTSTKDFNDDPSHYRIEWVPAVHAPRSAPLVKRAAYPHFSDAKSRTQLWRDELVPVRDGEVRRPNLNKNGILSTFAMQWYTWGHATAKLPVVPLLDGPRGVGTLGYVTHCTIGTAAPDETGPRDNLYVLDPWRVVKVKPDGTIITLAGYRHKPTPSYWADPQVLDLVGDWSAVPESRRGFHELWGMAWDSATLAVNESASKIDSDGIPLHPHHVGPAMVVADSQNNRVCRIEFSPVSHATPAKVTELITGLADPWDVVEWGAFWIVSERKANRICQYTKTGQLDRVVVSGIGGLATVSANRFVVRSAALATIQAQPCCLPDGLYVRGDWLYFGSEAAQQVRRVHLVTGELQVVATYASGKNQYMKIAVSDGTFGPEGTVFITGWTNTYFGAPKAILPGGSVWALTASGSASTPSGLGGIGDNLDYNGAIAVGNGRLVYGSSKEGLVMLSAQLPGDPTANRALYVQGRKEWKAKSLHLLHGDKGFGFYGAPLPWGLSEAVDYFLKAQGHK